MPNLHIAKGIQCYDRIKLYQEKNDKLFSKYWLKTKVFFHNLYFRWINGGTGRSHHFFRY